MCEWKVRTETSPGDIPTEYYNQILKTNWLFLSDIMNRKPKCLELH